VTVQRSFDGQGPVACTGPLGKRRQPPRKTMSKIPRKLIAGHATGRLRKNLSFEAPVVV
jgi:hypothetical protein